MIDAKQFESVLREVLQKEFSTELTPELTFNDTGLDSLDQVELAMMLEEALCLFTGKTVYISDDSLETILMDVPIVKQIPTFLPQVELS